MSTALDKQARELAERLVGKPQFYVTQEKAFCPGISGEWPEVIHPAHSKNARLKKVETESLIKEILAFATQVREQSKWVSVASGQFPDVGEYVSVWFGNVAEPYMEIWRYTGMNQYFRPKPSSCPRNDVTHWAKRPAPPETTEQEER